MRFEQNVCGSVFRVSVYNIVLTRSHIILPTKCTMFRAIINILGRIRLLETVFSRSTPGEKTIRVYIVRVCIMYVFTQKKLHLRVRSTTICVWRVNVFSFIDWFKCGEAEDCRKTGTVPVRDI